MSDCIKTEACFSATRVAQQYTEGSAVNITLLTAMDVRQQYKVNALLLFHGNSALCKPAIIVTLHITLRILFQNPCRKYTKCFFYPFISLFINSSVCSVVHLFIHQSPYFPPHISLQAIRRTL
jgi:hypothetical protein